MSDMIACGGSMRLVPSFFRSAAVAILREVGLNQHEIGLIVRGQRVADSTLEYDWLVTQNVNHSGWTLTIQKGFSNAKNEGPHRCYSGHDGHGWLFVSKRRMCELYWRVFIFDN